MTIGILARGPNAGQAVFAALAAVERVASGAIGGFVTYVAIAGGQVVRAETQRGGTRTLFIAGNQVGVPPPPEAASAAIAGLMSSGPDRPAPLAQFVPADRCGVLVSGHRIPNALGTNGKPINVELLARLIAGAAARAAVDGVLDADPEADAGLIAIDREGRIYARNSARVARRPDLGHARRAQGKAAVEVILNAIAPGPVIAELAAEIAMQTLRGANEPAGYVTVNAGTPLALGPQDAVIVDEHGIALEVLTTHPRLLSGQHDCAAIYLHAQVRMGEQVLGVIITEPYTVVNDGRIVSLSGQSSLRLGFKTSPSSTC